MEKVSPMWMEEKPISIEVEKGRKSSLNNPIIMEELDRALRNSKAGSVPGKDCSKRIGAVQERVRVSTRHSCEK